MARQPNSHWLSPEEEIMLLKRRQLLGNYYDTLALTSQVSTSEALEQLVPKSYANANYNHQFKGTLKIARRLFSVKKAITTTNRDSQQERFGFLSTPSLSVNTPRIAEDEQSRIVKFDQSLFSKENKNTQGILFHEEVNTDLDKNVAKKNQSTDKSVEIKDKLYELKEVVSDEKKIFSLEQAESTPLYAGWDEQLRKFVITNRYQNRALAGYTVSEYPERSISLKSPLSNQRLDTSLPVNSTKNGWKKTTVFTTWPIPNPFTQNTNKIPTSKIFDVDPFLDRKEYSGNDILKSTNNFLFQSKAVTNDMVNALLQWQKLMKGNKQLSKEDKEVTKEKASFWPDNIRRANWSNELIDNDMDFDEPTENVFKKKALLWEFTPPYHGGFVWSGRNSSNF